MKLSLNTRLAFGFTVAILLVLIVGGVSFLSFRKQITEGDLVKHTYEVITEVDDIQKLLIDMETGRRGYRGTADTSFLRPYEDALPRLRPSVNQLHLLVKDNDTQRENVIQLQEGIERLLSFWSGLGKTAAFYSKQDIINVTNQEKHLMDNVRVVLRKMSKDEDVLLKRREERNERSITYTTWTLCVGTVLILVIVIFLILVIVKEFRNRKKAELDLQKSFEELEALNSSNMAQNWLLKGVGELNKEMQGVGELSMLADAIMKSLVTYLQLPAGGLFIFDGNEGKLKLVSSMGLAGDVKKSYALGEGLPGRAGLGHELLEIKDVPAGYWSLESASGSGEAGLLVYVPLWLNEELKGVIELAGFKPLHPAQRDLLLTVVDSLATAINAAQAQERVRLLLERVQEQKEELEHQQEELRQTNEELTRQAEILQASEEELRVQEEELRQINTELEERNEAVEVARQSLVQKARELEVTSRYKSEFLANMSHELRTPLNSVLILANILSENKTGNLSDKQIEYAHIIHKSGSDLLKLINDILDLSKIEAGKVELNFEETSLKQIKNDIGQLFNVVAEEKDIAFAVNVDLSLPETVNTDVQRLEQVIKNLLSNAFKFTPAKGKVILDIYAESGKRTLQDRNLDVSEGLIAFAVKDTGIGIPEEKQPLIFEAFQQADGSTSRKYGGTGLGLSISKELVKILGGEMHITSEEGKGSTFTVYLPLNKVAAVAPAVVARQDEGKLDTAEVDAASITPQTKVADDRNYINKGEKVMLIIEDDPQFARIVQDFARSKKYKTIVALQGDEGLYYARTYKPAAIILDMQLPVIDGWSLLKIFKNDSLLQHIPVHIISAADESRLSSDGAIAYLNKPVSKNDLENAFTLIGSHILAQIKKVLVLSGDYLKDDNLRTLMQERQFDVEPTYAHTVEEAVAVMKEVQFDCIIADIGKDVERGVEALQRLRNEAPVADVPVIIYLDSDISPANELKLKRVSNVIIRESSFARDRLMDEMELFLYKIQEGGPRPASQQPVAVTDNNILINKKVLLVDDDMRNVFALSTALEQQQMDVITASDGKEALEQLQQHPDIQLVLMDIMMPEMDGFEAIRRIRNQLKLTRLPVIALTAKAMQGDKEKCIEAGASDYITKPVDTNRLFSLMRVWLSQ
ncbi:response regulator [Filimonas effusa]|uniref:histidine kinase n=1 Tax=Filimonas effusa TaxID=2508721 RepID=A0A4Q1DAW5_9BACT|nr:response regulator [Filimonas effusa]RXK85629.1 response regulator [Filimonas effusa]